MKILGNKSLSGVLSVVINVLWWLEWVGAIACIFLGIIAAQIRKGFTLQVPINYSPVTIRQLYPIKKDFPMGILNTTDGTLSIHVPANWQNITMLLIGYGLIFSTIVIITYQLKRIFENFKQNVPFNEFNMLRIRNIAVVLISYSFVQGLFVVVVNQILKSNLRFTHLELAYDFNVSYLLVGIALFVVEGVFRKGISLEEEKQLTI
ncbi:MAG: DUF2975 domain-containing protein [Mucilaginibacter sp.]|uniref:DUF2975 domain-containing protein n=1 Tax=Mucilaginibacter sp. TaxID=1882438 RepID=UPI0034E41B4E